MGNVHGSCCESGQVGGGFRRGCPLGDRLQGARSAFGIMGPAQAVGTESVRTRELQELRVLLTGRHVRMNDGSPYGLE